MMESLISVVVTAYNVGSYIGQCLDSILSQSYRNIEVIVVNDGSKDHTQHILEAYEKKDTRVRVITQENRGGGPARNTGVEAARGEYISILDGDDFFEPDMLKEMYGQITSTESDLVICDAYFYNNETHEIGILAPALQERFLPEKEVFSWKDIPEHIFNISTGFVWNKMYRLDFVRSNKLRFQDVRRIDDLLFEMKAMIRAKRITYIKKPFIYYRCNNPTSQQGHAIETADTLYLAYLEVKNWLTKEGVYSSVRRSFVNREVASFRDDLSLMNTPEMYERMYNTYREKYFKDLDLIKTKDFYYDEADERWLFQIADHTPAENLFLQLESMKQKIAVQGTRYPFPYAKMKVGSCISIYGAGAVGKDYFMQLFSNPNYKIASWVDRRFESLGFPILSPEALKTADHDYIIVAVENEKIAESIRKDLIKMGIDKDIILH